MCIAIRNDQGSWGAVYRNTKVCLSFAPDLVITPKSGSTSWMQKRSKNHKTSCWRLAHEQSNPQHKNAAVHVLLQCDVNSCFSVCHRKHNTVKTGAAAHFPHYMKVDYSKLIYIVCNNFVKMWWKNPQKVSDESQTSWKFPELCAMQLSNTRSYTFFSSILIFSSGLLQRHGWVD